MTDEARQALEHQQTVEITTIGRRTGRPSRIETWRYRAAGRFWLTGSPGARDWYANLLADPSFTLHLKGLDVPARARPVTDPAERARILGEIARPGDLESWLAGSPLAEIEID